MRAVNKLVLASLNIDKFREFKELFAPYPEIELVPVETVLRNAEKLDYAEVYQTYIENAAAKARLANQGTHYPCLADDTGLEVDGLRGRPGVRTRRYAEAPKGTAPYSKLQQDRANIEKLLGELKGPPSLPRNARFVTTLALVIEGILIHTTGLLEGSISDSPRGSNGFGYDSVFIPKGAHKTLAEMSDVEKNEVSHRAKAVKNLMNEIRARGIELAKP